MKIVVLGPTGGTGEALVGQALDAGLEVRAVARQPSAVRADGSQLEVVQGDVLDASSLTGVCAGADAVVSALGSHSGRRPTHVYSEGLRNTRTEMLRAGVDRLVFVSAIPVSPWREKSAIDKLVHPVLGRFFGASYDDLRRAEADVEASTDLTWTAVRPPRLLDGPAQGYRMAVRDQLPRARDITRADLAAALLAVLDDPSTFRAWITVSS